MLSSLKLVFFVAFISQRQKCDEREEQQEDGIYVAISTFLGGGSGSSWDGEKSNKEFLSSMWI